ncbi:hypothetical protein K435DRAFT_240412 [Dendrothele bispora CBS 962.96]|uniref:Uncharacterized protein n=1 Tax=Dendrothele bispora (strain CBS 962.96) TaxID=1314807 RepID=A0A4S8MM04_DENBC|nr:hypothetical protein K435DRAFT_240412 [Dendrothele bispora CBS 962.96]
MDSRWAMIRFFSLFCFSAIFLSIRQTNALYLPLPSPPLRNSPPEVWNPMSLLRRDVYSPPIVSPHEGDRWIMGSLVNVTWDTSNLPNQITNPMGQLFLGNLSQSSEHLHIDPPLASNFDIRAGRVEVQVPNDFPCGHDCILVLLGDSGNRSQKFTIEPAQENVASDATIEDLESLLEPIL